MKCRLVAVGLLYILVNCITTKCVFGNFIDYSVIAIDINALKALKLLNQTNYILEKSFIRRKEPIHISVKEEFESEFLTIINSYNIKYKSPHIVYKRPGFKKNYYLYLTTATTKKQISVLNRLLRHKNCHLLKKFSKLGITRPIRVHPQFKIEFEELMNGLGVEYYLEAYKDLYEEGTYPYPRIPDSKHFLQYMVIPLSREGNKYLKFLANSTYCEFDNRPYLTHQRLAVRIHPDFQQQFEKMLRKFNVTYKLYLNLYKRPDTYHYCDYSVRPRKKAMVLLNKLNTNGSCIIRSMIRTQYLNLIVTIHPDSQDNFEEMLTLFSSTYRLIACRPRKPTFNHFLTYSVEATGPKILNTLQRFGKESKTFDLKNITSFDKPLRLSLHPEYMSEFENILKTRNIHYSLVNYMPKEVDCNNYCAYLARPQDQNAVQALKNFLIKSDYIYWKSSRANNTIEIMILKEFKTKFEELMKTLNIEYQSLTDNFE